MTKPHLPIHRNQLRNHTHVGSIYGHPTSTAIRKLTEIGLPPLKPIGEQTGYSRVVRAGLPPSRWDWTKPDAFVRGCQEAFVPYHGFDVRPPRSPNDSKLFFQAVVERYCILDASTTMPGLRRPVDFLAMGNELSSYLDVDGGIDTVAQMVAQLQNAAADLPVDILPPALLITDTTRAIKEGMTADEALGTLALAYADARPFSHYTLAENIQLARWCSADLGLPVNVHCLAGAQEVQTTVWLMEALGIPAHQVEVSDTSGTMGAGWGPLMASEMHQVAARQARDQAAWLHRVTKLLSIFGGGEVSPEPGPDFIPTWLRPHQGLILSPFGDHHRRALQALWRDAHAGDESALAWIANLQLEEHTKRAAIAYGNGIRALGLYSTLDFPTLSLSDFAGLADHVTFNPRPWAKELGDRVRTMGAAARASSHTTVDGHTTWAFYDDADELSCVVTFDDEPRINFESASPTGTDFRKVA